MANVSIEGLAMQVTDGRPRMLGTEGEIAVPGRLSTSANEW